MTKDAQKTAVLFFSREKETKNAVRFMEAAEEGGPILGNVYVQKWWVKDAKNLQITVEVKK